MSLIFDELKYVESLLSGSPIFRKKNDIFLLAKYYRREGMKKSKILEKLIEYSCILDPNFNEVTNFKLLDKAVEVSNNQDLRIPQIVYVTRNELNKIRSVGNYKLEKILFTMLIISRHFKLMRGDFSEEYYINQNFSMIATIAHVFCTKKERDAMKHELYNLGFILAMYPTTKFKSNGKDNFKLLYGDSTSEKIVFVDNLDEIIGFYPPYCSVCGKNITRKSNRQTMCEDCWKEKRRGDVRNNVKKYRSKSCNQLD